MTLSFRERRILAALDEELSADPLLRIVADLFTQPAQRRVVARLDRPSRRSRPGDASPHPVRRPSTHAVFSVIGSMVSLICCASAASLHLSVVSVAGAVLAVCAALAFVAVTVHQRTRTTTAVDISGRTPAGYPRRLGV